MIKKTTNSDKTSLIFLNLFSKYFFHPKQSLISKFSIFWNKCQKTEMEFQEMENRKSRSLGVFQWTKNSCPG